MEQFRGQARDLPRDVDGVGSPVPDDAEDRRLVRGQDDRLGVVSEDDRGRHDRAVVGHDFGGIYQQVFFFFFS